MPIRKIELLFTPFLLLIFLAGCASTTAPGGWLPSAQETQTETFGAWISVKYDTDSNSTDERDGEFIAMAEDTVFILSSSVDQDRLTLIPISKIKSAKLTTYNSQSGTIALWTVAGALSTGSHGVGLIISFPVWILIGSISTSTQSFAPIQKFPVKSWNELKKYARFPQGLPKGLELEKLEPKKE